MKRITCFALLCVTSIGAHAQAPVTGFPPYGSFEDGRFDAINRQNLNVNFAIPVVSVPGRGMDLSHSLVYDSLIWHKIMVSWPSTYAWQPVADPWDATSTPTWGWKNSSPTGTVSYTKTWEVICTWDDPYGGSTDIYRYVYSNYAYTDPAGTRHPFNIWVVSSWPTLKCGSPPSMPRTGLATDGSGYWLDANTLTNPIASSTGGMKFTSTAATDPNGNFVSKIVVSSTETHWKDTLGRIALEVEKKTSPNCYVEHLSYNFPECIEYRFVGGDGGEKIAKLYLYSFDIQTNFGCSGVNEYSAQGVKLPFVLVLPNGRWYDFIYEETPNFQGNITGRLQRVTLPTGGYYEYTYPNPNNGVNCADGTIKNLTRVINDGSSVTWQYSRSQVGSDWKTAVTPPTNNISTYTFNSNGKIISEKHYQGAELSTNLKRTINTTWAANGTPSSTTLLLEDSPPTQSKAETTFDDYGNLTVLKEYGFGSGAPGGIIRTTQVTYENGSAYTARNMRNRIKQVLVRQGSETGPIKSRRDLSYDGTTSFSGTNCITGAPQHDDTNYGCSFLTRGNPISVTTYTNASAPSGAITATLEYDSLGNLRKTYVGGIQQTERVFSATTGYAAPDQVKTGPAGSPQLVSSATYDNLNTGLLLSATDQNGHTRQYEYDLIKRLKKVTRSDGEVVNYTYVETTQERSVATDAPIQASSRLKQKTFFDILGRPFLAQASDNNDANCTAHKIEYDSMGRPFKESNPVACGSNPDKWTQTAFDALGRVIFVTAPDSSVTSYTYAGATVTITDPTGKQRKMQTDALSRLVKVYEPDVSNNNSLTLETNYSYDVLDRLTQATQGVQTRTYTYDDIGRVLTAALPETKHQGQQYSYTLQYNLFNQVTQRTDPRGVITSYAYDSFNRLQTVSYNVGSTGVPATATTTQVHGAADDADPNKRGRLLSVTDGVGSEAFTYDQLGRVTQVQKVISGTNYTMAYEYNLSGQLTRITYPSGRQVDRTYDTVGRLASVYSGATQYVNSFVYDSGSSLLKQFKYGNNAVTADFTYTADLLQLETLKYIKNGDANPFFKLTFGYGSAGSNNGQIVSVADTSDTTLVPGAPGRSVTYTYDALHRLKTALTTGSTQFPQWGLSWTYDRYGNREEQAQTHGSPPTHDPSVDAYTNRIVEDVDHTYDKNGNMTKDGMNILAYDAENRMVSATGKAYAYDGAGLRVSKCALDCQNPTSWTDYIFQGRQVIAEYENGAAVGSPTREYVYSGGALVATHEGAGLRYHFHDHLSVRVTSDSLGGSRAEQGHYPFGEQWYNGGGSKWLFTDYERDSESGNDYAIFRAYIPRIGRFNRTDPLAGYAVDPQTLNLFLYVTNDPINSFDPFGLQQQSLEDRQNRAYERASRFDAVSVNWYCQNHGCMIGNPNSVTCYVNGAQRPCAQAFYFVRNDLGVVCATLVCFTNSNGTIGTFEYQDPIYKYELDKEVCAGLVGAPHGCSSDYKRVLVEPGGWKFVPLTSTTVFPTDRGTRGPTIGPRKEPPQSPGRKAERGTAFCTSTRIIENFVGDDGKAGISVTVNVAAGVAARRLGSRAAAGLLPGPGWLYVGTATAYDLALIGEAYVYCNSGQ